MLTRKKALIATFSITWLSILVLLSQHGRTRFNLSKLFAGRFREHSSLETYIKSWELLEKSFSAYPPNCKSPDRLGSAEAIGFNATTETPFVDLLKMSDADIEAMKQAHMGFVSTIISGDHILVYAQGTRGIVTTAGGYYLPVMVISLRMLRRTGSTLPVEVFLMDHSEYESEICDVLASLNAKCVILSKIVNATPHSVEITRFQLKIFAMIFSTFEEILFLDADSFPLQDPEVLFESELFKEKGMITWPDFWHSTVSEIYYTVTSLIRPSTSLRASSEAGEILISKKSHTETLLLAAYYNYFGPTHYYPLLSQGAPGEGDKETFLSAAIVLGQSHHAVSERVNKIGHWNPDKQKVEGSAMVQYDPRDDHNFTTQGIFRAKNPSAAPPIRAFFVHANFPKFNPSTIFNDGGPTRGRDGKYIRVWTDSQEGLGFDVEKRFWEERKWTACKLEGRFQDWKGKADIFSNVERYITSVFRSE